MRFAFDFICSPRISSLLYLFSPRDAAMCEQEQAFVHVHTDIYTHIHRGTHTLSVREAEKAVCAPLRYCQIAQAKEPGRTLKTSWCISSLSSLSCCMATHGLQSVPRPGALVTDLVQSKFCF